MKRKEKIMEIAQQVFEMRSALVFPEVRQEYLAHGNKWRQDFQCAASKLVQLAKRQQKQGKGAIQYVLISYLHSSILTKSYAFQMTLMDEHGYLDALDTSVYWSPSFIYRHVEQDRLCLSQAVSKELIRVQPYEIDMVFRKYIHEFYDALAGLFFIQTSVAAMVGGGIQELELCNEVQFLLGGLMDEMVLFVKARKEELQ